ncbi:MAG: hypothetical protein H6937_13110 [Burkholderiales bacterium]|nr:hypothetical protein [Burkholderiales bacterium]
MYLENNPDYMTIWQLAHKWINADPDETDTETISPKLREHIIRLVIAIRNRVITARTRHGVIFENYSFFTVLGDLPHYHKTLRCLIRGVYDKSYLDSIYVKRDEVIDFCIKCYYDLPQCWMPKQLNYESITTKENNKYRPDDETADRVRCQAIASALWELDSDIHPTHLVRSKILQRFGNGRIYREDTLKRWIAEVDPKKGQRKSGRPDNMEYKILLEIDAQNQSKS